MTINLPSVHVTLPNSIDLGSTDLLVLLLVGLVAGFLASRAVGIGGGLLLDMAVGVIGAFLGRWLFAYFGVNLGTGLIPLIIVAFVGAAFLLLIVRALSGGYGSRRRLS
jgi:uncharacterized membrane protein YeaQ/YmgE (transglycosylase-associated protein family)